MLPQVRVSTTASHYAWHKPSSKNQPCSHFHLGLVLQNSEDVSKPFHCYRYDWQAELMLTEHPVPCPPTPDNTGS